jgi:hypothetical protein
MSTLLTNWTSTNCSVFPLVVAKLIRGKGERIPRNEKSPGKLNDWSNLPLPSRNRCFPESGRVSSLSCHRHNIFSIHLALADNRDGGRDQLRQGKIDWILIFDAASSRSRDSQDHQAKLGILWPSCFSDSITDLWNDSIIRIHQPSRGRMNYLRS